MAEALTASAVNCPLSLKGPLKKVLLVVVKGGGISVNSSPSALARARLQMLLCVVQVDPRMESFVLTWVIRS